MRSPPAGGSEGFSLGIFCSAVDGIQTAAAASDREIDKAMFVFGEKAGGPAEITE